jgi:predicted GNAT family N-acyltransferase
LAENLGEAIARALADPQSTLLVLDGFPPDAPQIEEALGHLEPPHPFNVIFHEPEFATFGPSEASASLLHPVHIVTSAKTLRVALRKSLLRIRTQEWVRPCVLTTPGDLQAFFELRYRIWTDLHYLAPDKVCPDTPWELDYTDRTSLHLGLFSKRDGNLLAGGRLVRDLGMENATIVQTIDTMLRNRGTTRLIEQFEYPRTITHPFDILGALDGFSAYYRDLVRAGTAKAEVSRVIVDDQHRKRGLGEVVVDTLCSLARTRDIHRVFLACHVKHKDFYERSGFQAVEGVTGEKFLTYNVPCLAMERAAGRPGRRDSYEAGRLFTVLHAS